MNLYNCFFNLFILPFAMTSQGNKFCKLATPLCFILTSCYCHRVLPFLSQPFTKSHSFVIHLSFISLEASAPAPCAFSSSASRDSACHPLPTQQLSHAPKEFSRLSPSFLSTSPMSERLPPGLHTVLQCHTDTCCLVLSGHHPTAQQVLQCRQPPERTARFLPNWAC